jgi:mannosyltransferase
MIFSTISILSSGQIIKSVSTKILEFKSSSISQYLLLIFITIVASLLRFYKLGQWSFWIDEVYSVRDSLAIDSFAKASFFSLFYLLIKPVLVFLGTDEWSARLVPALIGIGSILLLYFIVKRIFSFSVAILTATLLAISPWHLYWSQNARFYTLLLLLCNLSLFAFYWGLEKDEFRYIALSFVAWVLAAGAKTTAGLLAPVFIIYVVLLRVLPFEKPPGLRPRNLAFMLLPLIGFGIHEAFGVFYLGRQSMISSLELTHGYSNHQPLRLLTSFVYHVSLPLVCLALFAGIYLLMARSRKGLLLVSGAGVPLFTILMLSSFAFTVDRYAFISLPSWIILAAVGVKEIFSQTQKYGKVLAMGVLVLLLVDPLSQDVLYYQYQNGNRPNWKEAFSIVEQHKIEGDLFSATRPEVGTYYLNQEVEWVNNIDPAVITDHGQRTWFVIDSNSWVDPINQEWIQQNSELVDVLNVNLPGKSLEVRVYLYNPTVPPQESRIGLD